MTKSIIVDTSICKIVQDNGPRGFVLVLPIAPSANAYWRIFSPKRGPARLILSAHARAYKKAIKGWLDGKITPFGGPVEVSAVVFNAHSGRDTTNNGKVLEDTLEGIAYVNDHQIEVSHYRRAKDGNGPRVVISIKPIQET